MLEYVIGVLASVSAALFLFLIPRSLKWARNRFPALAEHQAGARDRRDRPGAVLGLVCPPPEPEPFNLRPVEAGPQPRLTLQAVPRSTKPDR